MGINPLCGLCVLAVALLSIALCTAGEAPPQESGLGIGERAPAFTLKDQNGNEVSLDALLKKGPVVVVFYRSADWCLYCKLRLVQLQRNLKEIEAAGGHLAGISYDSTKVLKRFADRERISFPLLSDTGSKIIEAYGMLSNQTPKEQRGVSNHGAFIIDQQGIVRARFPALSDADREVVDELVKALKKAQNLSGGTKQ